MLELKEDLEVKMKLILILKEEVVLHLYRNGLGYDIVNYQFYRSDKYPYLSESGREVEGFIGYPQYAGVTPTISK